MRRGQGVHQSAGWPGGLAAFRRTHKGESGPCVDRRRGERVVLAAEPQRAVHVRRAQQTSVVVVGPGVVRTLNRAAERARLSGAQLRAAMPADIREGAVFGWCGAHRRIARPQNHQLLASDLAGDEGAPRRQVFLARGRRPHPAEARILLAPEDTGVRVVAGRKRRGAGRQGRAGPHGVYSCRPLCLPDLRVAAWGSIALLTVLAVSAQTPPPRGAARDWLYGGGAEQIRYSRLTQINRSNVKQLQVAWTYDTGEPGWTQTQPVVVNGVLYGYTTSHKTFAIKADTGAPLWTFDPGIRGTGANRGVILGLGSDARVFARSTTHLRVERGDGKHHPDVRHRRRIDLREHLDRDPSTQTMRLTTPA